MFILAHGACDQAAGEPDVVYGVPPDAVWAEREPLPAVVGPLALVTNNYDDTVSYIDLGLEPPRELVRLPVGLSPVEREGPHHLAVEPGGEVLWVGLSNYVPNSGSGPHGAHGTGVKSGYAQAISLLDGRELARVRVDRSPGDIRLTPDGRRVLLSHFDLLRITGAAPGADPSELDSRLAIIDTATRTRVALVPVCPAAHGISISADSRRAFVACWDDRVAWVDLTRDDFPSTSADVLPIPGTVAAPECQPYALTAAPRSGRVWVGCFESGELRGLSDTTGEMSGEVVDLGGAPLFGEELPDGRLVMPAQGRDGLFFLSANGAIEAVVRFTPEQCLMPHIVNLVGERLVLVCEGDRVGPGTLVVMDLEGDVKHVLPLGRYPDDLAIVPANGGAP